MPSISDTVNQLSPSATIAMAAKSRQLRSQGKDIISLSLGEPDFHTPDVVKSAAKKAIDQNYSKYTAVEGYLDVREAIAAKFERDNRLKYTPEQIVISTGAKQSLANVVVSLVNEGDEVIIPAPYWVTYVEQVRLCGGVPVVVPTSMATDFKITAAQLESVLSPKTKLVLFSNPCNPTGSVYSVDELSELAAVIARRPDVCVVADEIYEHIRFEGPHASLASFDAIYDQVITVNGVSKAFAMTGWRVGYIGASLEIAKACAKVQGQFTSGTSSISQRAAKAAVEMPPSAVQPMVAAFHKRRDVVLKHLATIEGIQCNVPQGAFYVFPDIHAFFGKSYKNYSIRTATDLCMYLLDEALVAVVTGEAFGNDHCIRISYASSEELLKTALSRMQTALNRLV